MHVGKADKEKRKISLSLLEQLHYYVIGWVAIFSCTFLRQLLGQCNSWDVAFNL